MKLVAAIIKPFKLEAVRDALAAAGAPSITVTDVQGYGRQKGRSAKYRGAKYAMDFVPKIKVEVAIEDEALERVIDAIIAAARTGTTGDGKIIVMPLGQAVRVSTGAKASNALR